MRPDCGPFLEYYRPCFLFIVDKALRSRTALGPLPTNGDAGVNPNVSALSCNRKFDMLPIARRHMRGIFGFARATTVNWRRGTKPIEPSTATG